jgi:hypothetical protein
MFNLCREDVYIQIVKGENRHRPFTLEWRILLDFDMILHFDKLDCHMVKLEKRQQQNSTTIDNA